MNEFHIIHPEKVLTQYEKPILKAVEDISDAKDSDKVKKYLPVTKVEPELVKKKIIATFSDFENALTLEETTNLINIILPPIHYELNDEIYAQHVSPIPGTRADVILLTKCLAALESQRKTKNNIVCPIRREIYTDLFDELIRQLSIQCIERGLLLLRLKNEISMTLNSYRCITSNFINFGCRQFELTEPDKLERERCIERLDKEVNKLRIDVKVARKRCLAIQKSVDNRLILQKENFKTEVIWYKSIKTQMKLQLDDIINQFKPE